ncbi:helix-turn-helix domain-containing protein [Parasegetibacter sp. NRK P23]|uniref:helix-turn-helix domain-containing protein n=1 Tax=Parasegetibacter sp. NRK P23 TaxID=2942999 RepID=UPI002043748B|nr:helix-turn-helix domain-containing protein [Parasegetibacter sp. NRK P23]MCM5530513.1 helix-turn-helix domain-containing protein [Parasegetibacter sp. NRK P23]MCM5530526.1 helix-turn-helix domain-containing protein [Parasegetibacter sp. NRK P23]
MNKIQLQTKIGQRIIELRTQAGWSQADLARACSKDRQAIEKIENGKVNPTIFSLYEISTALNIPLSKLLSGIQ